MDEECASVGTRDARLAACVSTGLATDVLRRSSQDSSNPRSTGSFARWDSTRTRSGPHMVHKHRMKAVHSETQ